ncbi:unnamed protein product [Lampetra planeri]
MPDDDDDDDGDDDDDWRPTAILLGQLTRQEKQQQQPPPPGAVSEIRRNPEEGGWSEEEALQALPTVLDDEALMAFYVIPESQRATLQQAYEEMAEIANHQWHTVAPCWRSQFWHSHGWTRCPGHAGDGADARPNPREQPCATNCAGERPDFEEARAPFKLAAQVSETTESGRSQRTNGADRSSDNSGRRRAQHG